LELSPTSRDLPPVLIPEFFIGSTSSVAQNLLGTLLIHHTEKGLIGGTIIETEAYLQDDPASHSFRGQTVRNSAMFGTPGTAYLYISYGMHVCLNVVTAPEGIGEAVLIRALLPSYGIPLMREARGKEEVPLLCSGPGKLTQALGLSLNQNGCQFSSPPLTLHTQRSDASATSLCANEIIIGKRIGISKAVDAPLRFKLLPKD
jgi:DNA-3-methyladenine glycosylase